MFDNAQLCGKAEAVAVAAALSLLSSRHLCPCPLRNARQAVVQRMLAKGHEGRVEVDGAKKAIDFGCTGRRPNIQPHEAALTRRRQRSRHCCITHIVHVRAAAFDHFRHLWHHEVERRRC
jgi:hypothetical protein